MLNSVKVFIVYLAAGFLAVGCTKSSNNSDSTPTSNSLTISGTLSSESSAASTLNHKIKAMGHDVGIQAVSLSDLEIYAVAFTTPPVIASATVNSDGSFTVDLPGAKGSSVSAIFRDKNDQSQVGMVLFEDSSKKDMKGNTKQESSITLTDSVSLGNIVLGTDGKVVIPVTQIISQVGSTDSVASGTAFDPTGVWTMAAFDGSLPTGYMTPGSNCQGDGPCVGFKVTLVRLAGKEFTPNNSTDCSTGGCPSSAGTDGGDKYALSIWGGDDSEGIGACGNKIGFSADEARLYGHINVASLPNTLPVVAGNLGWGGFVYSGMTGFCGTNGSGCTAPYNQPWMYIGATASHSFEDCRGYNVVKDQSTFKAWACKAPIFNHQSGWPGTDTNNKGWRVGIEGGGCFDSNNKPIRITNWGQLQGSCDSTDVSATYGTGFKKRTCDYTNQNHDGDPATAPISFKCIDIGGEFSDSSSAPDLNTPLNLNNAQEHLDRPVTLIAQNASCSLGGGSATTAQKFVGFRCYAEAYWSHRAKNGCAPNYNFDWSATDITKFVSSSKDSKPEKAFVTNIMTYSKDGQMGTVEDEQVEKISVGVGNNASTFCEIAKRTAISFKKVSDTRLLADLKQGGQMLSTDAACVSFAKDALSNNSSIPSNISEMLKPMKMMFYLDK